LKWQVPDRAAKAAFIVAAMDAEFSIRCNDIYSDVFDMEIAEAVCEIMFEDLLMDRSQRTQEYSGFQHPELSIADWENCEGAARHQRNRGG
jgi:hypothetical protein